jgi:hypothetical protein
MAEYFHFCVCYAAPERFPSSRVAVMHLVGYFELCADALESLLNESASVNPLNQQIYHELDEVWHLLTNDMPKIETALAAGRECEVRESTCLVLGRVFDWEEDGHHRAHVYIRTREILPDGLLANQRSLLLKAVSECLGAINP